MLTANLVYFLAAIIGSAGIFIVHVLTGPLSHEIVGLSPYWSALGLWRALYM